MIEDDPGMFCVVAQSCDQCHVSGVTLNRVTANPGDGGDWETVLVLCEVCLRNLKAAVAERLHMIDFARGDAS